MKKTMNMQLKRDEVDKSNEKENDVVKNLQRANEFVLTPSLNEPTLRALANARNRRACFQANKANF